MLIVNFTYNICEYHLYLQHGSLSRSLLLYRVSHIHLWRVVTHHWQWWCYSNALDGKVVDKDSVVLPKQCCRTLMVPLSHKSEFRVGNTSDLSWMRSKERVGNETESKMETSRKGFESNTSPGKRFTAQLRVIGVPMSFQVGTISN